MKWFLREYKFVLVSFAGALLFGAFIIVIVLINPGKSSDTFHLQTQCQSLHGSWDTAREVCVFK